MMLEAIQLRDKINKLLDMKMYNEALQELNNQDDDFVNNKKDDLLLLAEIAGSYITLGNESYNISSVKKGISIFQDHGEILKTAITEESIDYCLGNAYNAIYKITVREKDNFFPNPESVMNFLFDAKQFYLKAFKKIDLNELNEYSINILTNLGNNLKYSGRIVEALQLFDMVLYNYPTFPQAVVSKADGLVYMLYNSNCPITISLYAEIYRLYNIASEQKIVSEDIRDRIAIGKKKSADFLLRNNINLNTLEQEFKLNNDEYQNIRNF